MADSMLRKLSDTGETVSNADEDVRYRKVLDSVGKKIGIVDGLMIDDGKKVRFLRVEAGGFLGLGTTHVMIPVEAITNITTDAVTIDREGEHLHDAPRYDPEIVEDTDKQYWSGVYGYYGYYGFGPLW